MEPSPWSWHPAWGELTLLTGLGALYALAAGRFRPSRARVVTFAAGLVLAAAVLVTPVATLALHYLLSAHLFQNVALAEWVPALLVLGLSAPMASALARYGFVRALTHPLAALALWVAAYAVWHVPAVYDAALRSAPLLHLEHACYLGAGLLLWWPVFHDSPHELPSGRRAAYVFAAFLLASPVGLLLALVPEPIYSFYEEAPRLWNLSALTDQQIAGVIMAGSEAVVFFAAFAFFLLRFFAEEGAI
ncbi:MAG TPA: cytochrome c oxidase assembly protein [Gaiellaceae bacterium]|nr:cytochrome c oxidase assembly protein [Gaiellaceae bacterium]